MSSASVAVPQEQQPVAVAVAPRGRQLPQVSQYGHSKRHWRMLLLAGFFLAITAVPVNPSYRWSWALFGFLVLSMYCVSEDRHNGENHGICGGWECKSEDREGVMAEQRKKESWVADDAVSACQCCTR